MYQDDSEKARGREEEKAKRKMEKLRRSEILQSLTEEFSERPEVVVGGSNEFSQQERKMAEDEEERRR